MRPRDDRVDRLWAAARDDRERLLAAGLAVLAGLVVFGLAHELFPYHSANNDEGVYLQQAAMLLEGQLRLHPASPALERAVRPWFFVDSGAGLYPRYSPVPAAVFALGRLAGDSRLALAAVAAANVGLVYALSAEAFDRRTGLVAAGLLAAAPMFLLTSAVFLPYAPTTTLNLVFALAYVRSVRRTSFGDAVLAGAAAGLAFFARPYTAVLFGLPFVAHATWLLLRGRSMGPSVARLPAVIAGVGLAGVGLALGYNAAMTGSPWLFPYEAFAPRDGLGFGRRELLGYAVDYTPSLALRANATVLWRFATGWFTAGALGTAAAVLGVGFAADGIRRRGFDRTQPLGDRRLRAALLGIVATVCLGNIAFWGNLNVLADPTDPTDGFVGLFGPFYHFDLLLPAAAFGAHGIVRSAELIGTALDRLEPARAARVAGAGLLLAGVVAGAGAEAAALGPPIDRHAAYTERLETAYEPIRSTELGESVVFLPPTYGPWLNHPFQWLRNAPGFEGPVVYALDLDPANDLAVVEAYPDRSYYRYRYHGEWTTDPDDRVVPVIERVRPVTGPSLRARTRVAVPDRIVSASVSLTTAEGVRRFGYPGDPPAELVVDWTVGPDGVRLVGPALWDVGAGEALPIGATDEVAIAITITEPGGATLTYREELTVRTDGETVVALWPPASTTCTLVTDCGFEGAYVPDRPDTRPGGIGMDTTIERTDDATTPASPDGRLDPTDGVRSGV